MVRTVVRRRHLKRMLRVAVLAFLFLLVTVGQWPVDASAGDYVVVDTGQNKFYDNVREIASPKASDSYYGQDAQFRGNQPRYVLDTDGSTVYDDNTGLTWQRSPDTNGDGAITKTDKLDHGEAIAYCEQINTASFGGYNDWRLPAIKELYSLIDFRGTDPNPTATDTFGLTPFIDTSYFKFAYGDTSAGERIIDSQYASSTVYVDRTDDKLFGVNFADGRIKGYDSTMPGGMAKTFFVQCVRGNTQYGVNNFVDNGDLTVTDRATGLMWSKEDSGDGMSWQDALALVQQMNKERYLGYSDWRLPNAKELQSVVDYTRSPGTTSSAAIDPVFEATSIINEAGQTDYPFYWTSTTHASPQGGQEAVYVAFGRAMGYVGGAWVDVHGAGAQRSDPKSGSPSDYPIGRGPQGDAVRIYNYVRYVRGGDVTVVPEFSSGLIMPMLLTATLLLIVSVKEIVPRQTWDACPSKNCGEPGGTS